MKETRAAPELAQAPPRLKAIFPELELPWVPLGRFPTPVERLDLGAKDVELYIKRDDRAGELYGGNKVRKLELLLGDALARRKRRIVTIGAFGSHHALATTIYARSVGLEATLVLYPQPLDPHVLDDLLLDHAFGAELRRVGHFALAPAAALAAATGSKEPAVFVPPGGSSSLGTIGHVEAGLELAEQIRKGELPEPDLVVVAFGTGGTSAGLALGLALAGLRTRVVAVRVVEAAVTTRVLLSHLLRGARRILVRRGADSKRLPKRTIDRITIEKDQLGRGYGWSTPASERAKDAFAKVGISLETTYTGKAAAAFLALARAKAAKRILFWHTFSSVDLHDKLARVDARELPKAFHEELRRGGRLS